MDIARVRSNRRARAGAAAGVRTSTPRDRRRNAQAVGRLWIMPIALRPRHTGVHLVARGS
jgi:hypothetical protein